MENATIWAVFLPLITCMIALLFGRRLGDKAVQLLTCGGIIASAVISCLLYKAVILAQAPMVVGLADWINSGALSVQWALRLDALSVVMMCVITIVSSCVHVYSVGYMAHDAHKGRFMAYLSLFTFAMLMLVTADNLFQLFFGWEGVGLASYLLIGFWNQKNSANAAAMKAFIVNRVGDLGLALGLFTCFVVFGTVQFDGIFNNVEGVQDIVMTLFGYSFPILEVIGILLFIGAVGKSAQLGLHTWLPDAMEGPTPVSALIHAATMVTAGVFLVARFSPLYEFAPYALMVITYVGAATAIFAATIGMTQFDIKRVIAYSTMSQLGYMFFALGVSAYSAAMFHLVTHAFFKALLFLGAGSVIHAMSDEQDMRKMGGIWKKIPITYGLIWIGSLALAGLPWFAGYYSKDLILEAAWADHSSHGMFAFWLGIAAALMTAFYSWRVILMTFHGAPRADQKTMSHIHESPAVMLIPLFVLAFGALFAGAALYKAFAGHHYLEFWNGAITVLPANDTVEAAHHVPIWVKKLPILMGALGILGAYLVYLWLPVIGRIATTLLKPLHVLFLNKWYVDELYNMLFVTPARKIGWLLFKGGDQMIINGCGPDGLARLSQACARIIGRCQTGYVYHYAFVMMVAVVALSAYIFYRLIGGGN